MLCQIGSVQFEVAPFNIHQSDHESGASFAAHDVIGRMPSLEFMGEAPEAWTVQGTLFPKALARLGYGSGLDDLAMVHGMRRSGSPQFYMRGDGEPMGWVVIESVTERSTRLATDGVGRIIDLEIKMKRSDGPAADELFGALMGLFG